MQLLRQHIQNNSCAWVPYIALALIFVLTMQLHIHVHGEHQHSADIQQHNHEISLHKVHLDNVHDAEHDLESHAEAGSFAVDFSPEGLNKTFTSMLLACALIGIVILLLSPATLGVLLPRFREELPYIRRRGALPPQLRAPPR